MALESRFPGRCYVCGGSVRVGDMIDWDRETRKVSHEECTPADKKFKPRPGFRPARRSEDEPREQRKSFGSPFANVTIGGSGPRIGVCAFNKHIASEMQMKLATGNEFLTGSPEQDAIWEEMLRGTSHIVVNSCAGSGKSTTAQQGILRLIRDFDASAKAMTYHSLGLSILRRVYGKVDIDEHKLEGIVDTLKDVDEFRGDLDDDGWYAASYLATQLVRLCKNYLEDGTDAERLLELADYHNIDFDENIQEQAFKLVPEILKRDKANPNLVDFSDMTWLPVVLNLKSDLFDILIVDEVQDTDRTQQALAKLACPNGRIFVIGDKKQAIYQFRSADSAAMDRFEAMLSTDERGCKLLPLTVTRRCPKKHVDIAQFIVGDMIRPMDNAIDGTITQMSEDKAISEMRPGDMVICRVNRFLVPVCYALIQRGVKAVVRGRDIGAGLEALIKKVGSPETTPELADALSWFYQKERARLEKRKHSENRIAALQDRCDTLHEIMSGTEYTHQVIAKIQKIFADFEDDGAPKQAVILSTVHRGKGIEANRVFILAPELIPHPMASKQHEVEAENNIAYVAATRSMRDLIFVGGIPEIYGMGDAYSAVPQDEVDFHEGTY